MSFGVATLVPPHALEQGVVDHVQTFLLQLPAELIGLACQPFCLGDITVHEGARGVEHQQIPLVVGPTDQLDHLTQLIEQFGGTTGICNGRCIQAIEVGGEHDGGIADLLCNCDGLPHQLPPLVERMLRKSARGKRCGEGVPVSRLSRRGDRLVRQPIARGGLGEQKIRAIAHEQPGPPNADLRPDSL